MIEALVALVFGLLIGSFLNVCIHRWPRGRSVIKPRSHCVRCRKIIAWYDNIPVVSYAILRGRCRHCGKHISIRYPAVELLTGAVFAAAVWEHGPTLAAVKICVFGAMLLALIFCDLEKRLLPDELTIGGTVIGLAFAWFVPISDGTSQMLFWIFGFNPKGSHESMGQALLGAFLPAGFLWTGGWLYEKIRHREGLGFGDVKLLMMIGAFLGLQYSLTAMFAGCVAGTIISLLYIWITHQDSSTYELPFGSFLGAAALITALWP